MPILKKIFFLSLLLFILSALFWGVYNLSFKKNPAATSQNPVKTENNNSAPANEKAKEAPAAPVNDKISAISDAAVVSPVISADGSNIKYFEKNSGQAYEIDFYGKNKINLSSLDLAGLENAAWSLDKMKVILKQKNSDGGYSFTLHNFENNTGVPIKNNVDEISWQTNANRIFYKYYDSQKNARSLNVSNPDGTSWTKIADVPYRDISIAQIPKTGVVSFWNKPDAYAATLFQTVPVVGGEVKTIYKERYGADYLWDDSGNHALVSQTDAKGGNKIQLGMMNYNGGEYKNLNIPAFVSKCVWSSDGKTVYYALPGGIPDNAVLPNDYLSGKFVTIDTFWKVNIETGEKSRIVETEDLKDKFDASLMFLNSNESLLFFVNKIDGKLYKITL